MKTTISKNKASIIIVLALILLVTITLGVFFAFNNNIKVASAIVVDNGGWLNENEFNIEDKTLVFHHSSSLYYNGASSEIFMFDYSRLKEEFTFKLHLSESATESMWYEIKFIMNETNTMYSDIEVWSCSNALLDNGNTAGINFHLESYSLSTDFTVFVICLVGQVNNINFSIKFTDINNVHQSFILGQKTDVLKIEFQNLTTSLSSAYGHLSNIYTFSHIRSQFNKYFLADYNVGLDEGYTDGHLSGHTEGFEEGKIQGRNEGTSIAGVIPSVLGSIGNTLMQFLEFEVFGISLMSILSVIGVLLLAVWIIKLVF